MNRIAVCLGLLLLIPVGMLVTDFSASAQSSPAGIPDLNGVWGWGRCVGGGGFNCMLLEENDPKLTQRARAFQAAFDEVAAPKYDCAPMTIPHMYTDPYSYQIEQQRDRVIITYEKDDVVRTVWLDGFNHPKPALNQFFVHGHSTGRYEGNALIVETTKFTFDPTGLNSDFKLPSSTQKKVTERYSRDGNALMLEVRTEDTFFLKEPWIFTVRSQRDQAPLSLPWSCDLEAARHTLKLLPSSYPNDPPVVRMEQ